MSRRLMPLLHPLHVTLLTLLLGVLVEAAALYLLLHQPWLGIRVEPDATSGFVKVIAVEEGSPAAGIVSVGRVLTAIQQGPAQVSLDQTLSLPAFFSKTHADYQTYLANQTTIYRVLSNGNPVVLRDSQGRYYTLIPAQTTPLWALPRGFWVFSGIFMLVPLVGAFVWGYRRGEVATRALLVGSIGHYIFFMVGTLNLTKELAFSGSIAEWLALIEVISLNVYIFAFNVLFAKYPNQVAKDNRIFYVLGALSVLLMLNFQFAWIDLPIHNFLYQSFPPFIMAMVFSYQQVRSSRAAPINRTIARITQFSIIFPFLPIMLLHVLPLLLNMQPLVSQDMSRVLGSVVFVGLGIATLRYRLFEVEQWWFKVWLWLLGGILVGVIDIVLVGLLHTSHIYSLGFSVIVAGFLYFPLRQWLLGKLMPLDSQSVQDFLPTFSALMGSAVSRDEFGQRWQAALRTRFQPLHITLQTQPLSVATLAENGLHLDVPNLYGDASLRLTGKQQGMRLFGRADLKTVTSLLAIARIASNASDTRQQAVLTERTRIMRDLHDTVGAKLLTLSHTLPTPRHRQAAQESLQTLRDIINLTLHKTPFLLGEYLADWRAETVERAEAAGVKLHWQIDPTLEYLQLRPGQVMELLLFVRDTTTRLLQSPAVTRFDVCCDREGEKLTLCFKSAEYPPLMIAHSLNFT
ncbi:hypothetical protein [Thiothrix subterranea]|uniref:Signal transduction histidine kinase subgroup 3 dimerisation and phosphoacceptor domain-containing protein n=1 Tax=Thiothrix subterranea TaxID=2735563 RepID=A0AA51MML8_9GAMM|nr:hypothetical protein [Thiothrix subterranea]MDQ5768830.1 hypothetical protein [Thiothrix subterranea]WML86489.1 hypothetical protein RCG00_19670 [Thiothrix subterranea]